MKHGRIVKKGKVTFYVIRDRHTVVIFSTFPFLQALKTKNVYHHAIMLRFYGQFLSINGDYLYKRVEKKNKTKTTSKGLGLWLASIIIIFFSIVGMMFAIQQWDRSRGWKKYQPLITTSQPSFNPDFIAGQLVKNLITFWGLRESWRSGCTSWAPPRLFNYWVLLSIE